MKKIAFLLTIIWIALLSSCNFGEYFKQQFPELDTTTYVEVDGTLLLPVAYSTMSIMDLVPKQQDSTKYVFELGENNILKVKKYVPKIIDFNVDSIGVNITLPAGGTIPTDIVFGPITTPFFDLPSAVDIPGTLYIAEPRIIFYIYNQSPLEIQFNITKLTFRNSNLNQNIAYTTNITLNIAPSPDGVNYARSVDSITTKNFPQFPDAILFKPNKLSLEFNSIVPAQTVSANLSPNQNIYIDALIELPFIFYAKDIIIWDTVDFNLDLPQQIDIIDAALKTIIENEMAVGARLYMAITDSLLTDTVGVIPPSDPILAQDTIVTLIGTKKVVLGGVIDIPAAPTDQFGDPTQPASYTSYLKLPAYLMNNIKDYKGKMKLLLAVKINSYNSDNAQIVKIYGDNKITVKLGIKVDYATSSQNF